MKAIPLQDTDQRLVQTFRALGHPARLLMVRLLAERRTCICGEIVDELPLSQSTVSQHLKVLKDAGLIIGEVEGPALCYCLAQVPWPPCTRRLRHSPQMVAKGVPLRP